MVVRGKHQNSQKIRDFAAKRTRSKPELAAISLEAALRASGMLE